MCQDHCYVKDTPNLLLALLYSHARFRCMSRSRKSTARQARDPKRPTISSRLDALPLYAREAETDKQHDFVCSKLLLYRTLPAPGKAPACSHPLRPLLRQMRRPKPTSRALDGPVRGRRCRSAGQLTFTSLDLTH